MLSTQSPGEPAQAQAIAPATGLWAGLGVLAGDIKLSHTIFAMPYALLATFLAAGPGSGRALPSVLELLLILGCMVTARTTAMLVNRLADAKLDALNPRTARRALASGKVSQRFAVAAIVAFSVLFFACASGFYFASQNAWPLILSPLVLSWVCLYSYTKRFTWLCHLVLGTALAISPLAAGIAMRPTFLLEPVPWLLAANVTCWVAGFDILYAMQDVDVDRRLGLFSMPSRLGVEPALWVSRLLHAGSLGLLIAAHQLSPHLREGFAAGLVIVALLLLLEHVIVWRSQTRHIDMAFFTLNGIISVLVGALGVWDVLR